MKGTIRATWRRLLAALAVSVLVACSASPSTSPVVSPSTSPTSGAAASPPAPSTGADRRRWLAYQTTEGNPHIRLVHKDGTGDHVLVTGSHPDWSPDGQWIAYEVDSADIWIIRVDGSGARRVFDCEDPCVIGDSPAWSPDGLAIAFTTADAVGGKASKGWIKSVQVETGDVRTLLETNGPDYPFYSRWAPDGNSFVVTIQRFSTIGVEDCSPIGTAIGVVDANATAPTLRMLTPFDMYADYPDWSPDGGTIVFTTFDLGTRDYGCAPDPAAPSDLYVIAPDGTRLAQLTHNERGAELVRPVVPIFSPDATPRGSASGALAAQPTWAPDGQDIVFVRVDGPVWPGTELWTMAADGANPRAFGVGSAIVGEHPRLQPLEGNP